MLAGAIPGAVIGDSISYWLGRHYGPAITKSWPLSRSPALVVRGEAFLRRYGTPSVAIGRFFGPIRAVIPLLAGIARMDRRKFWVANVASAIVWAPAVMLPGAILGWMAESADRSEILMIGAALLVAAIAAGLAALLRSGATRRN